MGREYRIDLERVPHGLYGTGTSLWGFIITTPGRSTRIYSYHFPTRERALEAARERIIELEGEVGAAGERPRSYRYCPETDTLGVWEG